MRYNEVMTESTPNPFRHAREDVGDTLAKWAEIAETHSMAIHRYERGQGSLRVSQLRRIADYLGVPTADLVIPGRPLIADTREELQEITGPEPVQSLCEADDPIATLAQAFGRDPNDPETRPYLRGWLAEALDRVAPQH